MQQKEHIKKLSKEIDRFRLGLIFLLDIYFIFFLLLKIKAGKIDFVTLA